MTRVNFLQKAVRKTPVFVRFSNFIGSKGSKDTAIDIRGFATKFYTEEGNYDMLALSFAVFSIMDAMKFADFVQDRKSTRLNSSHVAISYAVFCLKKKR